MNAYLNNIARIPDVLPFFNHSAKSCFYPKQRDILTHITFLSLKLCWFVSKTDFRICTVLFSNFRIIC